MENTFSGETGKINPGPFFHPGMFVSLNVLDWRDFSILLHVAPNNPQGDFVAL